MSEVPAAISLSDLPAAEARAIFDRFMAGQPERLAGFVAEVRRRGGPADRLDYSVESLEPLWRWFLAEHRPRRWFGGRHRMPSSPVSEATMRQADPPWWYDFHPTFCQELGPYLAGLVTGLSEYIFACVLRARPASRWAPGSGRSYAYFQHPVLQIDGRDEMDYANPIVQALMALRGERNTEPTAVSRWLSQWLGLDPAYDAEMERLFRPAAAYAVEAVDDPRFTHQVSFDDVVAHRQEARIEHLVTRLVDEPAIEYAVHEDREVILARAPGLSDAELERVVERLWKRRRGGSHAKAAPDV